MSNRALVTRYTVARGIPRIVAPDRTRGPRMQCGRTRIPTIDRAASASPRSSAHMAWASLVAWEEEQAARLADLPDLASAVTLLIGPEGGLDAAEIAAARAAGFHDE